MNNEKLDTRTLLGNKNETLWQEFGQSPTSLLRNKFSWPEGKSGKTNGHNKKDEEQADGDAKNRPATEIAHIFVD